MTPKVVLFVALLALGQHVPSTLAENNGLALTPPMGWNPWNCYASNGAHEDIVLAAAHAMVDKLGPPYQYINLDCGWSTKHRDPVTGKDPAVLYEKCVVLNVYVRAICGRAHVCVHVRPRTCALSICTAIPCLDLHSQQRSYVAYIPILSIFHINIKACFKLIPPGSPMA